MVLLKKLSQSNSENQNSAICGVVTCYGIVGGVLVEFAIGGLVWFSSCVLFRCGVLSLRFFLKKKIIY